MLGSVPQTLLVEVAVRNMEEVSGFILNEGTLSYVVSEQLLSYSRRTRYPFSRREELILTGLEQQFIAG